MGEEFIVKNSEGKGMLPMKQSPELEAKKSMEQHNIELCNFIKNAFCADGDVFLLKPNESVFMFIKEDKVIKGAVFEINDSERGKFYVSIMK